MIYASLEKVLRRSPHRSSHTDNTTLTAPYTALICQICKMKAKNILIPQKQAHEPNAVDVGTPLGRPRSNSVRLDGASAMSAAALKQKTTPATTRSPFEDATAKHAASDEDIDMDEDVESDEEDVPEKDETEKKLERMLFGDDEGFMGALKSQQERADAMQLTLHSDEESGSIDEEAQEEDDVDLDNIADEDVCYMFHMLLLQPVARTSLLTGPGFDRSSFLIPATRLTLWTFSPRRRLQLMTKIQRRIKLPLCGTTVTTSGLLSR